MLLVSIMLAGCQWENLQDEADVLAFNLFGKSLVSNTKEVKSKKLHLELGSFIENDVIVHGLLAEVGKNATYLVINDKNGEAKMLVVLTGTNKRALEVKKQRPAELWVKGVVKSGKKGLPYIAANALFFEKKL